MSGFFTRLAQRTLGTAQTIRPNIAPLFSQNPTGNQTINSIEETKSQPSKSDSVSLTRHNNKAVSNEPQIKAKQNNPPVSLFAEHQLRSESDAKEIHSVNGEALNRIDQVTLIDDSSDEIVTAKFPKKPHAQITESAHSHNPVRVDLIKEHFFDKQSNDDALLVPMPVDSIHFFDHSADGLEGFDSIDSIGRLSVNPSPLMPQERIQNTATIIRQETESQTINVSIGRIEVRAVHPQPAPIKTERIKTKSALSLEDYLQQRRKGER